MPAPRATRGLIGFGLLVAAGLAGCAPYDAPYPDAYGYPTIPSQPPGYGWSGYAPGYLYDPPGPGYVYGGYYGGRPPGFYGRYDGRSARERYDRDDHRYDRPSGGGDPRPAPAPVATPNAPPARVTAPPTYRPPVPAPPAPAPANTHRRDSQPPDASVTGGRRGSGL